MKVLTPEHLGKNTFFYKRKSGGGVGGVKKPFIVDVSSLIQNSYTLKLTK